MSQVPEDNDHPICDYEGSTYRTDFWEGRGREYEDAVERVALRAMLPPTGGRLIDIGAGFGRLADLYAGYRHVVLMDYSRSQLEFARQRYGDERFTYVAADIYSLPLASNLVECAVMVRVLHHLIDVPAAFAQIARIVRPGGTFVLEFANKRHLKQVLRYLLGRGVNPFDPAPYEFSPLHFDFHPRWVMQQLRAAGLEPLARRTASLLRSAPLKRIFPTGLLVSIDAVLQRPLAGLTPGPSVFVRCRRAQGAEDSSREPQGLFRCPSCGHEPLEDMPEEHICSGCGAHWPILNGIHVFKDVQGFCKVAGASHREPAWGQRPSSLPTLAVVRGRFLGWDTSKTDFEKTLKDVTDA